MGREDLGAFAAHALDVVLDKLGTSDRVQSVVIAHETGLVGDR